MQDFTPTPSGNLTTCISSTAVPCGTSDCSQLLNAIPHATSTVCSNDTYSICKITSCEPGFHTSSKTIDNCKSHVPQNSGYGIQYYYTEISGIEVECTNNWPFNTYSYIECVEDDINNCGGVTSGYGNNYDCTTILGWDGGECEKGVCVPTSCKDGYDLINNKCQQDVENFKCGDIKCSEYVDHVSAFSCVGGPSSLEPGSFV